MPIKYNLFIEKKKRNEVESFIQKHGSIFHSYDYLSLVGTDYYCVIVESKVKGIVGALPLVKSTRHYLKAYHIPPYTYQFGPVLHQSLEGDESKVLKLLLQNLPKAGHYEFKSFLPNQDALIFKKLGFSVSVLQTHLIPSKDSFDINYLSDTKKQVLQKLLEAQKEGKVKLIENKDSNLDVIRDLWKNTAERAGFDPKVDIVKRIFNLNLPNYNNVIVDQNNIPLSGSYCLIDNSTAYHLISANQRVDDKLLSKANVLALYHSIKFANQRGLTFDTEGSSIPGVAEFYRYMGAQPKFIYRIQKSASIYYQFVRWLAQLKREYDLFSS